MATRDGADIPITLEDNTHPCISGFPTFSFPTSSNPFPMAAPCRPLRLSVRPGEEDVYATCGAELHICIVRLTSPRIFLGKSQQPLAGAGWAAGGGPGHQRIGKSFVHRSVNRIWVLPNCYLILIKYTAQRFPIRRVAGWPADHFGTRRAERQRLARRATTPRTGDGWGETGEEGVQQIIGIIAGKSMLAVGAEAIDTQHFLHLLASRVGHGSQPIFSNDVTKTCPTASAAATAPPMRRVCHQMTPIRRLAARRK